MGQVIEYSEPFGVLSFVAKHTKPEDKSKAVAKQSPRKKTKINFIDAMDRMHMAQAGAFGCDVGPKQ